MSTIPFLSTQRRRLRLVVCIVAAGLACSGTPAAPAQGGQNGNNNGGLNQSPRSMNRPDPFAVATPDPAQVRADELQERRRNEERQKKLVEDTTKLLQLANELKAAVDKSDKNTLSMDVMRKSEEIEKLAHSVHERMRGES